MFRAAWSRTGFVTGSGARFVLPVLLGAALLAGCGGGPTASPRSSEAAPATAGQTSAPTSATAPTPATGGAGTLDVCSMISTDQVAAIVGKPVTVEPVAADQDWAAGECWWNSDTMAVRFSVDVGTQASIAKSTSPTAQEQFDLFKIASLAPSPAEVSSVGDAAAYGNMMLIAIKGGSLVQVFGLPQDQAADVARLVLVKVP